MLRIVTYDSDTDGMIIDGMVGYIICVRDNGQTEVSDPAGYGDFRVQGHEWHDGHLAIQVEEVEDIDGDYVGTGKQRFFAVDNVTITIY